jgi:TatD DNase family protein
MLIDIHCHLQDSPLREQSESVFSEIRRVAVSRLVCNGESPDDWPHVADLANRYPEVLPCFGVHPWFVHEAGDNWEPLLRDYLARYPAALGECGIDRWVEPRDEALQERLFRRQLQIAAELDLPIMIHVLRAWGWFTDILASEPKLPSRMLLHSYGGSPDLIKSFAAHGCYFSFSGNIVEPKRQKLRDALSAVPLDRLLIETDAPAMLPPEGFRTHQATRPNGEIVNHPANLPLIYTHIANHLRCPREQLEHQVEQNARTLLGGLLQ